MHVSFFVHLNIALNSEELILKNIRFQSNVQFNSFDVQ